MAAVAVDSPAKKMEEKFECKICNRKFDTNESLVQHNTAKHFHEKVKKKSGKKYLLLSLFIIAILLFSYTFYVRAKQPGDYNNFAKCLTENGTVIYGNDYCQYTNKQLNMFGKSKEFLNYVKCSENQNLCDEKAVKITPTWEIKSYRLEGVQEFEKLSEMSGCEI